MKPDKKMDTIWYIIGWALLGIGALYFIFTKLTGVKITDVMMPCMFNVWTGWYCPGCGGTRAVKALFRGDILASVVYHPVVPFAAVIAVWFMISQTIERVSKEKCKIGMHFSDKYLWIILALIIANFIVKNVCLNVFGIDLLTAF